MAKAQVIVLTNCTHRKRASVHGSLQAHRLPRGSYEKTSQEWLARVQAAPPDFIADQLYCGRVVTEALRVSDGLKADLTFVSAGLGLVQQSQRLPSYSLTASEGHVDSVSGRITDPYDPKRWWESLAKAQGHRQPLARFIDRRAAPLVLLAMPSTYLAMVAGDLAMLAPEALKTLRVIGPRHPDEVPESLRPNWLPYDARLDSPSSGINGTASDFAHRALRHFAEQILPHTRRASAPCHAAAVEQALSQFKPYVRPRGQTASDDEVISAITHLWDKHGGRRTPILRELRSVRRIACEQSRFRQLADRVAASFRVPA